MTAVSELVAKLRADAEQLRKMMEQAAFGGAETGVRVKSPDLLLAVILEAADALSILEQQVEEARAVIEPFAKCADQLDGDADIPRAPDDEWAKFRLIVSDYRRARAFLASLEKNDG